MDRSIGWEMENSKRFSELSDFIQHRMKMSHIYQPAMLTELLKNGGSASVDDIARTLLTHDQSQIEYYSEITKNMVGKVLSENNGITKRIKVGNRVHGFELNGFNELSSHEVQTLIAECKEKMASFLNSRGSSIWDHRRRSSGYISGSLQYEVLKRAKFRCELCGIMDNEKALQVDHIIPRNHGGSDDISNLQSLCYSCNAMKRDQDDTDFRSVSESYKDREVGCIFCEVPRPVIVSNELCYAIEDGFPVTAGHVLIIPKRHVSDFFDLYQPELNAAYSLLGAMKEKILSEDETVAGFNIGINSGQAAGQTVFHCHIHLIPRRDGDVPDPRGGVRGVIPNKKDY